MLWLTFAPIVNVATKVKKIKIEREFNFWKKKLQKNLSH
jgi:hypothetical protein